MKKVLDYKKAQQHKTQKKAIKLASKDKRWRSSRGHFISAQYQEG